MNIILMVLSPLQTVIDGFVKFGRWLAVTALAIMVCFILYQVVLRYFFNSAPNWTEEAARFGMLWMTGLIAPLAYRQGGFVCIDIVERALTASLSRILMLILLLIASVVIYYCVLLGWDNVTSLSGRGRSASLQIPLLNGEWFRLRNYHAYYSLFVGFCAMAVINVELILRQLIIIGGGADRLKSLEDAGPID